MGTGSSGYHSVRLIQISVPLLIIHIFHSDVIALVYPVVGADCSDNPDILLTQKIFQNNSAHLSAASDQQYGLSRQGKTEHFICRQRCHGHSGSGDHRLRPDPFGAGQRRLKNTVQFIARISPLLRKQIGVPRLSQNFILTDHHGFHTADHLKKMPDRLFVMIPPDPATHPFHISVRLFRQHLLELFKTGFLSLRIDFHTVAGRQHDALLHLLKPHDLFQKPRCILFRYIAPLPVCGIRRFMADTDTLHL